MNDLVTVIVIATGLPTFFLLLRVLSEVRSAPKTTTNNREELEQHRRRHQCGQARAAELSYRQQSIREEKRQREEDAIRQREEQRWKEDWGWDGGWPWSK